MRANALIYEVLALAPMGANTWAKIYPKTDSQCTYPMLSVDSNPRHKVLGPRMTMVQQILYLVVDLKVLFNGDLSKSYTLGSVISVSKHSRHA